MRRKVKPAAGWQRPLASRIKLRDGQVIETLAQAVGVMTQRLPSMGYPGRERSNCSQPVFLLFHKK
jgi:hypothetical protein